MCIFNIYVLGRRWFVFPTQPLQLHTHTHNPPPAPRTPQPNTELGIVFLFNEKGNFPGVEYLHCFFFFSFIILNYSRHTEFKAGGSHCPEQRLYLSHQSSGNAVRGSVTWGPSCSNNGLTLIKDF